MVWCSMALETSHAKRHRINTRHNGLGVLDSFDAIRYTTKTLVFNNAHLKKVIVLRYRLVWDLLNKQKRSRQP